MLSIAVPGLVFNSELLGAFVRISGCDSEGDFLDVTGKVILSSGHTMEIAKPGREKNACFALSDFQGDRGLQMEVYQTVEAIPLEGE